MFFSIVPYFKTKDVSSWALLRKNADTKLLDYSDLRLTQILLFGDTSLDVNYFMFFSSFFGLT